MKHVCLIGKYNYPRDTFLRQQARVFEAQNLNIDIICLGESSQKSFETQGKVTVHRFASASKKYGFMEYLTFTFLFGFWAFYKINRISLTKKYATIIVHTLPEFLIFITLFQKLFKIPIVLYARDITMELLSSRWLDKKMQILYYFAHILEKACFKFADHAFVASHGFMQRLIERGVSKQKLTLLLNTADPVIFSYKGNREYTIINHNARILYHGTVSRRFGIIYAIKTIELLREKIPGTRLDIYGMYDPGYKQSLLAYIDEHSLQDSVSFHNSRSLEEIATIISKADFGIVPYINDSFMNLALSTKTFEYVAMGLPVVASRLQSAMKVFSENALSYVEPQNSEKFARKIEELCHDPKQREECVKNALKEYNAVDGNVMAEVFRSVVSRWI